MDPTQEPTPVRDSVAAKKRKRKSSDKLAMPNKKPNTANGGAQLNGAQESNFPDMSDEATTLTAEIKQLECEVQNN
jgi:hypothetical protein